LDNGLIFDLAALFAGVVPAYLLQFQLFVLISDAGVLIFKQLMC